MLQLFRFRCAVFKYCPTSMAIWGIYHQLSNAVGNLKEEGEYDFTFKSTYENEIQETRKRVYEITKKYGTLSTIVETYLEKPEYEFNEFISQIQAYDVHFSNLERYNPQLCIRRNVGTFPTRSTIRIEAYKEIWEPEDLAFLELTIKEKE